MITAEQFRRLALALPGAEEASHHGHPDFRLNGKVFASLDAKGKVGMARVTPVQQRQLVQASAAFKPANGAWGKQGCTMLQLDLAVADHAAGALTMAWEAAMLTASIASDAKPAKAKKAAKKAPAKRAAAKQAAAKKPTAKKPVAKKAAAKKPIATRPTKKAAAKRSSR